MKKLFKILLISLVVVLGACVMFACAGNQDNNNNNNNNNNNTPNTNNTFELPDVIEGYEGKYEVPVNTAYGAVPDLDNVVIDGIIDDELWEGKNWYVQYQPMNPDFKFEVTTAFSEKGVYVAAKSDDKYVYWLDRNKFYINTYVSFRFVAGENDGVTKTINIDANNTPPTGDILNVRSTYKGEINNPGKSNGLYVEGFFTWEQLGYSQPQEEISLIPIYKYKVSRNDNVKSLYNTFIVSDAADLAAQVFNTDGFIGVDKEGVTVGNHKKGLSKTLGWKVETDEDGNETASVQCNVVSGEKGYTPKNFTQAIFFKEADVATRFMITARLTVNNNLGYTRAGLLMYRSELNYRAYGIEIGEEFSSSKKTFDKNKVNAKAWTNYPSDIVTPTDFGTYTINTDNGRELNEVDLTVFNSSGNLYYLLNGKFIYSESASYVGENCFLGLYSYNADVTFSNYEYKIYNTEDELRNEIKEFIYTVDIYNNTYEYAEVALSQIAANNDGNGNVDVIMTYNAPSYDKNNNVVKIGALDNLTYSYVDENGEEQIVDVTDDAKSNSVAGVYTIKNIPGNISINFTAKEVVLDDYVIAELKLLSDQTGKPVTSGILNISSADGNMTNYSVRFNASNGCVTVYLPKGHVWNVTLDEDGYRPYSGVLNGGLPINESMDKENPEEVTITATVIGGIATDHNGTAVGASAPGQYWDLSQEVNSKATFTSTNTGSSHVYFSGPTVSDYQVAYVEITNQTDYTAFRSIEDDPGAGFAITGTNGKTSRALLWKTGVRIINDPSLSWSEGVKSMDKGCNYPGHIAVIDRANNGAVAGVPYEGTGTINRVPYGDKSYTTSFLMIRKGGNIFLYAADGSAGVTPEDTQAEFLSKMTKIHSYYNPIVTGEAAIGFAITVSFNLRLDFENYWIITDDDAAAFADNLIRANIEIEGSDIVNVESNGMFEGTYDSATGKGVTAVGSTVTLSYKEKGNEGFPANKLLKITLPNGSVKYISSLAESCSFEVENRLKTWKAKAELVDAVKVVGKVIAPYDGFNLTGLDGSIKDADGVEVAMFTTSPTGEYVAVVEGGREYVASVNVSGFASNEIKFTASNGVSVGDIGLEELNIGASGTAAEVSFGKNDDLGVYAKYYAPSAKNGDIMIKSESKKNFVLEYTFYRSAKQSGEEGGSDETDLGIGMIIKSDTGEQVELMNMSDGYRILTSSGWAGRDESRGKGGANVQPTTISPSNAITIKFIKVGGTIYLYNKYEKETNFRHIYTWTSALSPTNSTPVCAGDVKVGIHWTSTAGRFLNLTFYNVSLSDVNEQTAPEVYGALNVTAPVNGTVTAATKSGEAIENGTVLAGGTDVVLTVTPASGYRVKALYVNNVAVSLGKYTGGVFTYTHISAGETNVRAEFEVSKKEVTIELTEAEVLDIDSVIIVVDGAIYATLDVSGNPNKFSESCAYLSGSTLKMILPEGVATIKLMCGDEVLREIADYEVK